MLQGNDFAHGGHYLPPARGIWRGRLGLSYSVRRVLLLRHHKPMRSFWPYALGFLIAFSFLIGLLVWEWSCGPRHGWATAYPVCDFWTEQIAASKKTNRSATFALSTWMPDQNWEP